CGGAPPTLRRPCAGPARAVARAPRCPGSCAPMGRSCLVLLDGRHDLAFLDRLAFLDQDGADHAGSRGLDGDLHFHGLEGDEFIALVVPLPDLALDFPYGSDIL